jgi:LysM repeat protein
MSTATMSTATLNSFGGTRRIATPTATAHLRMTARGRSVLASVVAAPLVVAALAFGLNAGGATATSSSTPLATVTVTSGETLWQVARHLAPNADPRDVVADLMDVNQLTTADIVPGEQLKIPAQYGR